MESGRPDANPPARKGLIPDPKIKEVHILWITRVWAATATPSRSPAASNPSIEDVVLGAIPGLPKVHLHNPVLAYEGRRRVP